MNIRIGIKEFIFAIGYFIVLLKFILSSSTIRGLSTFDLIDSYYLEPSLLILLVLVFLKLYYLKSISVKVLSVFGILSLIFGVVYIQTKAYVLLYLLILMFLAIDIPLKFIVKTFLYIKLPAVLILLVMSLTGVIENYEFIDFERGSRYGLGAVYATDFAAGIFYLQLAYYYLRKGINLIEVAVSVAVVFIVFYLTDARLSLYLMSLAIVLFYILGKNIRIIQAIIKIRIMSFIFIIAYAFSVWSSYFYDYRNEFMSILNQLFTSRLSLGNRAFNENPITIFGQRIELEGNGWVKGGKSLDVKYNFIDASYLQWTLIYGLIFTVIMLIVFTYIYWYAIKSNDYALILIFIMLAVSGIVDHHLLNLGNNPFILALPAALVFKKVKKNEISQV